MAKTYGPKIYASDTINTKSHWAVGTKWTAIGSRGDEYEIEMKDNGFTCSCPAFRKCKHIKAVEENF
jgi:hypothetical protein